jgi:uncharacterized protein (TIGR00159 family)
MDFIEVCLVAALMYQGYRLLRGSIAFNIFFGILVVFLLYFSAVALDMVLLPKIFQKFVEAGVLIIIIVFQPEIRRFLLIIGRGGLVNRKSFVQNFLSGKLSSNNPHTNAIKSVYKAILKCAESKTGALIVIADASSANLFGESGILLNANLSSDLLESIFFKNAPLHDGAVIVNGNKILAARSVLPVSNSQDMPSSVGLRHRSALGVTEHSDVVALIVSEENGSISYAKDGKLFHKVNSDEIAEVIKNAYGIKAKD